MNITEFAIKNVYRNIKAYFAYFISSTISAALLFSFTMIIFHPSFQIVQLPDYLNKALNMTIVIAYLFLCFFFFFAISALKYAFGIPVTTVAFQIIGVMLLVQIIYFLVIRKNYLLEVRKELIFNN